MDTQQAAGLPTCIATFGLFCRPFSSGGETLPSRLLGRSPVPASGCVLSDLLWSSRRCTYIGCLVCRILARPPFPTLTLSSLSYFDRSPPFSSPLSLSPFLFSLFFLPLHKMRLPYTPNPPQPASEAEAAVVSRIQARRAPRPLQPLDLTLLHSPPVADGWNTFLGAVRTQTTLAADVRELAISRVAVANRAWYEWAHHAPWPWPPASPRPPWMRSRFPVPSPAPPAPPSLSEAQWAVLLYTDEMTRDVEVRDETFALLKGLFTDREVVELTATVSSPANTRDRVEG